MSEIKFDFKGIINLLAKHLYSEKKVFIRELVQNAHDAIRRRQAEEPGSGGRIDIYCRPDEDRIVFKDTGLGMSREDLENYLSSIGSSGSRESDIEGVIGQFGIGFLSAFIVAKKVEVRTRRSDETQGWLWVNEGDQSFTLESCEVEHIGTTVDVTLAEIGDRGLIRDEFVKGVIRHYCDLLLIPIHVGASEFPVNTMHMPWEREGLSDKERNWDCHMYLEKTMQDSVLETIPLQLDGELKAKGVLYISRSRSIVIEAPRTIRVFQKRMFLCENAVDLLPKWATFVNGVIDSPVLTPTAARDNYQRDEVFGKLRDTLGSIVIGHLEKLKTTDPDRLSQILRYHELSIKAMCHFYDEFFEKFSHLLEWKINSGDRPSISRIDESPMRRLPLIDILALLPAREGAPKRLSAFSTSSSANQFFELANANETIIVDASHLWDAKILEKLARRPASGFDLLFIDREEDPKIFRVLHEGADDSVRRLAEAMAQVIRPGGDSPRVDARHFNPPELVAILRSSRLSVGHEKARQMLDDPNVSHALRAMAEEMVRLGSNESLRLTINASNAFIQRLARQDFRSAEVAGLMLGVYNNAILYNQELLTARNAKIFHDQFAELLERGLNYIDERVSLHAEREALAKERRQREASERKSERSAHRVFFLMSPFKSDYLPLEDLLREVIEDRWSCQLFLARDRRYDDRVLENVGAHMERADAFLAEVTEHNPNVMFELGAARHAASHRPITLLCRRPSEEVRAELPADLQGLIYLQYDLSHSREKLRAWLETELRKNEKIAALIDDAEREHFLSHRRLRELSSVNLDDSQVAALGARFPTMERWRTATAEFVIEITGLRKKTAEALIDCVAVAFQTT